MGSGASQRRYRHWTLTIDAPVAILIFGGHCPGGSGVEEPPAGPVSAEVELADAVQRLRFEHPEVGAVVLTGGGEEPCWCGGDDVLLSVSEVGCAIEDASANSGQHWLAALNGSISGPGYELALATDEILLVDDGRARVALPDLALSGQRPDAHTLARLLHKRGVRPDLVDLFCTDASGVQGRQAQEWGLVDQVVPPQRFAEVVRERALTVAGPARPAGAAEGVPLLPLRSESFDCGFAYPDLRVEVDREAGTAALTLVAPDRLECLAPEPGSTRVRTRWWPLAACRQLDDALIRLRADWPTIRTLIVRTEGAPLAVAAGDVALLAGFEHDWFVREVVLLWRQTLDRLERTPQSVVALIEPGSCFVGSLFELALAADRAYILDGADRRRPDAPPAEIFLTGMNFGLLPGVSRLTRLERRFAGQPNRLGDLAERVGDPITAPEATRMGLVTAAISDVDWPSHTAQMIEERNAVAPRALARLTAFLRTGSCGDVPAGMLRSARTARRR